MDPQIEVIEKDIQAVIEKLDALMRGKSRDAGFLIERFMGTLEGHIREELPLIEKAIT